MLKYLWITVFILALAGCRSEQAPAPPAPPASTMPSVTSPGSPPATVTPGFSTGGGQPKVAAPTATPTVLSTPTAIPPTATPTPDRTREAEARIVTLDYRLPADPQTLDPTQALPVDEASQNLSSALFIRLTRLDPTTGQPRPWLAREWRIEGNTITVSLRDDVAWVRYNATAGQIEPVRDSQGQPRRVQASDVVYAVRRALDAKDGADTAYLLYILQGGREYNQQPGAAFEQVGVSAVDAFTVQFRTTSPAAYLPTLMSLSVLTPLPEWLVQAAGANWTDPDKLVTSGPYALTEWAPGKQVTLLRNPHYPDRDQVQIERLRFPIVADAVQAYTLFTNGNLDSVDVPESERAMADRDMAAGRTFQALPNGCTTFVGLTTDKLPLDRVQVRQALAAAIDRQALVDRIVKAGLPTVHLAPAGVFGAQGGAENSIDYNPDAARSFLAAAGFPQGRGFPPLTYAYNTCESPTCRANQAVAEALRDMWTQTLGIQVNLESLEWPAYLQRINRRTPVDQMPHAWRMAWCQDYPDQHNWLYDAFYINAPGSYSRSRPGRFDEIVAQAAGEADANRRVELYREAERVLLLEEARVTPLYTGAATWASQPWLTRQLMLYGGQNFDEWKLDWDAKRKALGK